MTVSNTELLKQKKKAKIKRYMFCYSFCILAVINFLIFYVGVNLNNILMAFREYSGMDENFNEIYKFSFGNFARVLGEFKSPESNLSVGLINTLKYFFIGLFLNFPLTVFVSFFIYKKVRFFKFFRVVFFLPGIISGIVYVNMFKIMISQYGPIYTLLEKVFGVVMPDLLHTDSTATPTIIFYCTWTGLGSNMILYLGAMARIPQSVIEVGVLEGIPRRKELFNIVLPMIWPTLSMTIIISFTGIFMGGGPLLLFGDSTSPVAANNTMTLPFYIFYLTWNSKEYNYPAAIGLFFTLCGLPIMYIIRKVLGKFDPEVEY